MILRFIGPDKALITEFEISAEHWAVLKREARKAHLKVHDFVIKVIEDYCDMVLDK